MGCLIFRRHYRLLVSWILFYALAIPNPATGNAQMIIDATRQYEYAQSRFKAGAFAEAIVEFNRFIYFFPKDPKAASAHFQTGMAHFHLKKYGEAATVFTELTENNEDAAQLSDAYIMLSRSHFLQGNTQQAAVDLHNLLATTTIVDVKDRVLYEMGWLHINQNQWFDANRSFEQISISNQDRYQVDSLKQELTRSHSIPSKNPTTAGLLSIVPGVGQVYCNRYRDALTAFIVNAGLIWASWEAFDNELYAIGGMIGFVEFGFYAGNIYGAISSAHKYNRDRNAEFRDNLHRYRQLSFSLGPMADGGMALGLRVLF